jgi:hypothetical protein
MVLKKTSLRISDEPGGANELLFALVSHESELKVCMILNDRLNIQLSLGNDIVVNSKTRIQVFRRYQFEDEEGIEKYIFIVNRNEGNILFNELKQVDYLFLVKSESALTSVEPAILELRDHHFFTAVHKIGPDKLRNYHKILE